MTVDEAFAEMKKRGWGFYPSLSGMVAVGPFDGHLVEAWGMDTDPVRAVEKAIDVEAGRGKAAGPEESW